MTCSPRSRWPATTPSCSPCSTAGPPGDPLDLYNYPDVISSGELTLASEKLAAGKHRLAFEIKGANPSAMKAYMIGLDYLRLVPR